MKENIFKGQPYLFEVSWEVCNKVGGIHTVISTKALSIKNKFKNSYILIGPDIRINKKNPEFKENPEIYRTWKQHLADEGINVRIGQWKVEGRPTAIVVDFTPFFAQKNRILKYFWDKFQVDSIAGQWDYIEPVIFGYAAGKVIESFIRYNLSYRQPAIAQFHEWMTGSGLLYLKDALPRVGCVFTSHATVLGRCIAGNGLPLYDNLKQYDPGENARIFNVVAKQSLERKTAEYADCFTTVSSITARECEHFLGKKPDMISPNGFEDSILPNENKWEKKREEARKKLLQTASAILGEEVDKKSLLVCISGRYEFKNKGIDVFLDALKKLNGNINRNILAFLLIPNGFSSLNPDFKYNLSHPEEMKKSSERHATHIITAPDNDPILKKIRELQINNAPEDKVKVFFCPFYLNGNDDVFKLPYYDLLAGMDLTVFPSYYEPWGYTPLESIAYQVPTITTTLAGFGLWVNSKYPKAHPCIKIIERNDGNYDTVVCETAENIKYISELSPGHRKELRENAREVVDTATWQNLSSYYMEAYQLAIDKVSEQVETGTGRKIYQSEHIVKPVQTNLPTWISVIIHRSLPERLMPLEKLAKNLWWSWNRDASELFEAVAPDEWEASEFNPIALLDKISLNRYKELENDEIFISKMTSVYNRFIEYMSKKKDMKGPAVAYFSMEYGLHSSLKIYSGGLGILAGDYLKEASDKSTRITAVGLLYKYGYFTQKFSHTGDQEAVYEAQDFTKIPVSPVFDSDNKWLTVEMEFPGRTLYARIWKVDVGRTELYLLDTDFESNNVEDRSITHHLYGGDWENRLKQEILLGFGGVRALRKLNISTDVFHCNEGHAAFIGLERIYEYMENEKLSFHEALEVVRASSLFTTHTPVPAGHDLFKEDTLKRYLLAFTEKINISWSQLLSLGKINTYDPNEKFSMSFLAANLSQEINGVSKLHGEVSKSIFNELWPGYMKEESPVTYVTNGVHYPTWTAPEWKAIQEEIFGKDFMAHHYHPSCFKGIYSVNNKEIVKVRNILRKRLIDGIKKRLSDGGESVYFTPRQLIEIRDILRDDILTIGFARRFATYKRGHLLFSNIERLEKIINDEKHPVQIIFAGKAHPADKAGQDLIKHIVEISKRPEFIGKILFLPNYDMRLAQDMVRGVDIWVNTPTRLQEASGTSGQKAAMNGVLNLSVLDGWWYEGYRKDSGWALPVERIYENPDFQNEFDSELIYNIIEDEIVPAFYAESGSGSSTRWVEFIKNNIANIASNFTTNRMLTEYEEKYYMPLAKRGAEMKADNFSLAIEIAEWKNKINRKWDNIKMESIKLPDISKQTINIGEKYTGSLILELSDLTPDDIGVEVVATQQIKEERVFKFTQEFSLVKFDKGKAEYNIRIIPYAPGLFTLGIRIFPKNPALVHRQDFPIVRWL